MHAAADTKMLSHVNSVVAMFRFCIHKVEWKQILVLLSRGMVHDNYQHYNSREPAMF